MSSENTYTERVETIAATTSSWPGGVRLARFPRAFCVSKLANNRSGTGPQTREGLGLGLFIVDQIVSAHRGTITVSSPQEEGAIFWCAFRAGYRHERDAVVRDPTPPAARAITKRDANGIRFSRHPGHYPGFVIFEKADSWH